MDEKPQHPEKPSNLDPSFMSYEKMEEDPFFKELLDTRVQTISQSRRSISDLGQISNLSLPENWIAGQTQANAIAADLYKEYNPPNDSDVKLCFYYRGMRCSEPAGDAFRKVLSSTDHQLDAAEYQSLQEILRNKSPEYFSMGSAYTKEINGKRILIVEGSYDKSNASAISNKTMYIDSDSKGTAVQEIYFQAPTQKFQKHFGEVDGALKSIEWK